MTARKSGFYLAIVAALLGCPVDVVDGLVGTPFVRRGGRRPYARRNTCIGSARPPAEVSTAAAAATVAHRLFRGTSLITTTAGMGHDNSCSRSCDMYTLFSVALQHQLQLLSAAEATRH